VDALRVLVVAALGALAAAAAPTARAVAPVAGGDGPTPVVQPVAPAGPVPLPADADRVPAPEAAPLRSAPPQLPAGAARAPAASAPPEPDAAVQAELARLRAVAGAVRPPNAREAGRSAWLLGLAALHGVGGPVQPGAAQAWFARAQRLGEPLATAGLAWCAVEGCGEPPDPQAARRWIAALRLVDAGRAQYLDWLLQERLAPLHAQARPGTAPGTDPGGVAEPVPARRLLEAAARAGSLQAQLELAIDAAAAGRAEAAAAQFEALAPRSPAAAANLALVRQQLPPRAGDLDGPGAATYARALRAHRGDGRLPDYAEAVRLYRQARQEGSAAAARMLGLILSRPTLDGGIDPAWMRQLAQLDLRGQLPVVDPAATRTLLRREPTALSDLLPPRWR
jgi:TPR repeat protein